MWSANATNNFFIPQNLTTCFGPYGPSSGDNFCNDIQYVLFRSFSFFCNTSVIFMTMRLIYCFLIYIYTILKKSVLVSGPHLGPATNFSFSSKFPSDSCVFVISYHPLWREDGSVIYCRIASGPCQSSHSWVEVPQNSRPYFTVSFETPSTWRARFPYLYPPRTGLPNYTAGLWVPFMPPLTTRRAAVEVF
jgi:hypothetical protein